MKVFFFFVNYVLESQNAEMSQNEHYILMLCFSLNILEKIKRVKKKLGNMSEKNIVDFIVKEEKTSRKLQSYCFRKKKKIKKGRKVNGKEEKSCFSVNSSFFS